MAQKASQLMFMGVIHKMISTLKIVKKSYLFDRGKYEYCLPSLPIVLELDVMPFKTRPIAISRVLRAISDRPKDGPTDRPTDRQHGL